MDTVNVDHDTALWWLGNALSLTIGISISLDYGMSIGVAVAYALLLLVDIRHQTAPD